MKIFLKNLTFYSGSGVRSDILGIINTPAHMMEDIERRRLMNEIFDMSIASFYQTGKIPISGEKYLDIGDITLPLDTENFPDTIRLYFQYRDQYLIQSIVSLQAIAMWLYAFNSQHLDLVRTTMQEFYMNLTYESLRYPEDNMRFYLIESLMNNFNYELTRYVTEMTDSLDARDPSSTYNKFIENDEKLNVSIEEVKLRQQEQELQNDILRDNVEKQMAKQLVLDKKLEEIMEEKPQLEWDEYHDSGVGEEQSSRVISHFKEKEFQEAKNNFLENLREESHAIILNDLRHREDIRNGNINNLTRQIEILNDNLLNNKLQLNTTDTLNTNLGSDLDKSQMNNLQNYLYEDSKFEKNDQRLIDTVGVLKDEIMKTNAALDQQERQRQIEKINERQQIQLDGLTAKLIEQEQRFNLQQEEFNKRERQLLQQQQQQQQQHTPTVTAETAEAAAEISTVEDLSNLVQNSLYPKSTDTASTITNYDDLSTINYNNGNAAQSIVSTAAAPSTINVDSGDDVLPPLGLQESIIDSSILDNDATRMLDEIDDSKLYELEKIRDGSIFDKSLPSSTATNLFKPTDSAISIIKKLKNIRYNIRAAADRSTNTGSAAAPVSDRIREKVRKYNRERQDKAKRDRNFRRIIEGEPLEIAAVPEKKAATNITEREIQETMQEVRHDLEQLAVKNLRDVVDRNVYRRELEERQRQRTDSPVVQTNNNTVSVVNNEIEQQINSMKNDVAADDDIDVNNEADQRRRNVSDRKRNAAFRLIPPQKSKVFIPTEKTPPTGKKKILNTPSNAVKAIQAANPRFSRQKYKAAQNVIKKYKRLRHGGQKRQRR